MFRWFSPAFRFRRRLPARLGVLEVACVVGIWFLGSLTGYSLAVSICRAIEVAADAVPALEIILGLTLGNTLIFFAVPIYLRLSPQFRPWQLGMHRSNLVGAVVFGLLQSVLWGVPAVLVKLKVLEWMPQEAPHVILQFLSQPLGGWTTALLFYATVIATPFTEELLFRGVLQGWLNRRLPAGWAIGLSAGVFAAAHHGAWPDPIPLFILGVGLGYTYQATRSLWAPIAFHAFFNGCNLLIAMFGAP